VILRFLPFIFRGVLIGLSPHPESQWHRKGSQGFPTENVFGGGWIKEIPRLATVTYPLPSQHF